MAAKLPNATERIKTLESAIAKMEGELEAAAGSRRTALKKLIEEGQRVIERLKSNTLH
jgi:hypothetical protein